MKKLLSVAILLIFPLLFVEAKPIKQVQAIEPKEFIRVKKVDGKVSALEIAVTRYQSRDGNVTVDLVGVVHIGDSTYYNQLNRRFPKYDAVLYELVAPQGTKPEKKRKDDLSSLLPKMISFMLDLDMQLALIDYDKKNFIHADLSFDEMLESVKDKGDDKLTIALSVLVDMLKQNNLKNKPGEEPDFSKAIENPNLLKQQMASQMVNSLELGATMKRLLVDARNKKACEVLVTEMKNGKKSIAIFYGAAHNNDFDKRLRTDHGFICINQEWLTAWGNLDGPPTPPAFRFMKLLMEK